MRGVLFVSVFTFAGLPSLAAEPLTRKTAVNIAGEAFHINGRPTYADHEGRKLYVALPGDAYLACGHGGSKMLWIVPSLDLVCAWRIEGIDDNDSSPGSETTVCARAARLLAEACRP